MDIQPKWWSAQQPAATRNVTCRLCFHHCTIAEGKSGYCTVRNNESGELASPYLGRFFGWAVDPIEKKPLYHWMPGTFIFSLGSIGCNMRCGFCQNWSISQPETIPPLQAISPEELVRQVQELALPSVAFTYNEPTLQAEYIIEAGPLLKKAGIAVALVTNGMVAAEPLEELLPWMDAANIDIKTFSAAMYKKLGGSLTQVQKTVTRCVEAGKHIELTCLVVPGVSDSFEEFADMIHWIAGVSPGIPLHLSRYFPKHRFTAPATDISLLQTFASFAGKHLEYVHIGNI